MSYKKLEIWQLVREIVIEVHQMSLQLPRFELYEQGSQIRRSSKTVKAAIVEGYGRRMYKADWIKYLVIAHSSNDETLDHLETLWETKSLQSKPVFETLHEKISLLGKKLNGFIVAVQKQHISEK
jgi:four helix bundle protein